MGTIDTLLRVKADARQAVSGLKPLQVTLEETRADAEGLEKSLNDLDKNHHIDLDNDAVERARRDIEELQRQMRRDIELGADTRLAQRRIRELRSAIKFLDGQTIDLDVDVDTSSMSRLGTLMGGVGTVGSKMPGILRAIGTAAGAVTFGLSGVAVGAGALVLESLKLSDSLANAKISFTQFLGSGKEAEDFLGRLQQFASKTPFEFPELVESSKQLLAFGIESEDIIDLMTSLGDAAALTGTEVTDLTTIWGQMQAKGRVANEELLQLVEHGIPAYDLLAESMGKTPGEIQKMAEQGQLLSDDVLPILQQKLDDTFGGGMAEQAKTLSGLFSTMKDTLGQVGTILGDAFTPVVSEQLKTLTTNLEEFSEWASENKAFLVESFGVIAEAALNWAADMTAAFQGIIESAASLFDVFAASKDALKILAPGTWFALRDVDLEGAADSMHVLADGLGDVSGGLRTAADESAKTAKEWAKTFERSDTMAKFNNDIGHVKDRLAELRQRPPSPEVDLKIHKAEQKLAKLKADRKEYKDGFKTQELDVKIDKGEKRIKNITESIQYLKTLKPSPEVKLELKEWRRKRKVINDDLKKWHEQQDDIEFGVNATADDRRQTTSDLDDTANPDGKPRKAEILADPFGLFSAAEKIDEVANPGGKHRTAYIDVQPVYPSGGTDPFGFNYGTGSPFSSTTPGGGANASPSAATTPISPTREKVGVSVYLDGRLLANVPGRVNRRSGRRVA